MHLALREPRMAGQSQPAGMGEVRRKRVGASVGVWGVTHRVVARRRPVRGQRPACVFGVARNQGRIATHVRRVLAKIEHDEGLQDPVLVNAVKGPMTEGGQLRRLSQTLMRLTDGLGIFENKAVARTVATPSWSAKDTAVTQRGGDLSEECGLTLASFRDADRRRP